MDHMVLGQSSQQLPPDNREPIQSNLPSSVKKEKSDLLGQCSQSSGQMAANSFPTAQTDATSKPSNSLPQGNSHMNDEAISNISKADLDDYISYAKSQLGHLPVGTIRDAINQKSANNVDKNIANLIMTSAQFFSQSPPVVSMSAVHPGGGIMLEQSGQQGAFVMPSQQISSQSVTMSQANARPAMPAQSASILPADVRSSLAGQPNPVTHSSLEVRSSISSDDEHSSSLKCDLCDRTFASSKQLKRHVRNHTECRPYKCSLCSRSFFDLNKLKRHTQTHSGLKPYECHICDQKVSRPEHLKRHLLTHSELRPFKCSICDFTARRNDSVRSHIKSKHPGQNVSVINMTAYLSMSDIEKLAMEQGGLNRIPGSAPKRNADSSDSACSDSPAKKKKKSKKKKADNGCGEAVGVATSQFGLDAGFLPPGQPNVNKVVDVGSITDQQKQINSGQIVQSPSASTSASQEVVKENDNKVKGEIIENSENCMRTQQLPQPPVVTSGGNVAEVPLGAWNPDMARLPVGGTTLGQAFWDPNMTASVQFAGRAQPRQPFFLPEGNVVPQQLSAQQLSMAFSPQGVMPGGAVKQEPGMNTCSQEQLLNQQVAFGSFGNSAIPTQVTLSPYFMNAHAQSKMFLNGLANRGKGSGKRN